MKGRICRILFYLGAVFYFFSAAPNDLLGSQPIGNDQEIDYLLILPCDQGRVFDQNFCVYPSEDVEIIEDENVEYHTCGILASIKRFIRKISNNRDGDKKKKDKNNKGDQGGKGGRGNQSPGRRPAAHIEGPQDILNKKLKELDEWVGGREGQGNKNQFVVLPLENFTLESFQDTSLDLDTDTLERGAKIVVLGITLTGVLATAAKIVEALGKVALNRIPIFIIYNGDGAYLKRWDKNAIDLIDELQASESIEFFYVPLEWESFLACEELPRYL